MVCYGYKLFGVLIIVRPGSVKIFLATLKIFLGAVLFSTNNVIVKVLSQTGSATTMVFSMNMIQTVLTSVPAFDLWTTPEWLYLPWLFLLGLAGIITHYFLTKALVLIDTSVCFPLDFWRLPFIAILAYFLWEETFSPWTVLGAGVIFSSTCYSVWRETKEASKLA